MRFILAFAAVLLIASTASAERLRGLSSYTFAATVTELTNTTTLGANFVGSGTHAPNFIFRMVFLNGLSGYVGFYVTPYAVGASGKATDLSGAVFLPPDASVVMMAPKGGGIIAVHSPSNGTLHVTEMAPGTFPVDGSN